MPAIDVRENIYLVFGGLSEFRFLLAKPRQMTLLKGVRTQWFALNGKKILTIRAQIARISGNKCFGWIP